MRHGGKILIDQLEAQGTRAIFLVPGESFLAALDAMHGSSIRPIVCRHEGGAAMMAEATGKLTGRPGVAFVTRGPGAANAVAGVYVAHRDETPMVLFVGLPPQRLEDRAPFQDFDLGLFAPIAKWVAVVRDAARLPEFAARAFATAISGRTGPVVIGLPEDVLSAKDSVDTVAPAALPNAAPSPAQMNELAARLSAAKRPLMLVGGPGWSTAVADDMTAFARAWDLPVAAAFRCQDYIDNRHPCYVGHAGLGMNPALADGIGRADLILAAGAHLGEVTTGGYRLIPRAQQSLVIVHPAPEQSQVLSATQTSIAASLTEFARAARAMSVPATRRARSARADLRKAYEATLAPLATPGSVSLARAVRAVSDTVPEAAIITNGAGNYTQFLHRYFVYKGFRTQLAPASGSMGYGLPAAIAAKVAFPERPVVAFAGDGCLQMTLPELATAVQYGLPLILIVANNAMHGTIRMHQERHYPGRVVATSLVNPDFAALARSYGAEAATVTRDADFEPCLRNALGARAPFLIDLKLDPEAITPTETLANIKKTGERR